MKQSRNHCGITLTEMLVALSIVVILMSAIIGLGRWLIVQSEIRLTESAIGVLDDALEYYLSSDYFMRDIGNNKYPVGHTYEDLYSLVEIPAPTPGDPPVYTFLADSGASRNLIDDLIFFESASAVSITAGTNEDEYACGEALYYFLNDYPDTASIVSGLDERMISADDEDGVEITASIDSSEVVLFRYVDAWGSTLLYSYESATDVFPVIRSAGPDKAFFTEDDIVNSDL